MVLFKYIEDKDRFQHFYTEKLSDRLTNQLSAPLKVEVGVVGKLEGLCGKEYTVEMERVVTGQSIQRIPELEVLTCIQISPLLKT